MTHLDNKYFAEIKKAAFAHNGGVNGVLPVRE